MHIPVGLQLNKDNNLNLKKDNNRVLGETRTWKVNSQVEVEPSYRAHAQLLARQECSVVEFEIRTTLSIPKGAFEVTFRFESRDRQWEVDIENILEVFRLEEVGSVLQPEEKMFVELIEEKWLDKDGVEHSTSYPQIITRGTCVCINWTDQKVDIKTSPLSMDESTSDGDHSINKMSRDRSIEDSGLNSFVVVN
ncbi:uncharacterized protein LOC131952933 [Physella acuta]|uniref:uncharacterized protein LOC131952933 n=1 Tax=Physella acuta TaxID=109671 RepID=UPI0027DD52E4|nr:uncharacterized protein LOC131952933 [Physella acuta]